MCRHCSTGLLLQRIVIDLDVRCCSTVISENVSIFCPMMLHFARPHGLAVKYLTMDLCSNFRAGHIIAIRIVGVHAVRVIDQVGNGLMVSIGHSELQ